MMRDRFDRFRLPCQVVFFVLDFVVLRLWAVPSTGIASWLLSGSGKDPVATFELVVSVLGAWFAAWKILDLLVDVWDAFALFFTSPLFKRRWRKFTSIKRGYWSFLLIVTLYVLSFFSEFLINNKAIFVKYQGKIHFTLFSFKSAREFGVNKYGLPNYRQLQVLYENRNQLQLLNLI